MILASQTSIFANIPIMGMEQDSMATEEEHAFMISTGCVFFMDKSASYLNARVVTSAKAQCRQRVQLFQEN